MPSEGAQRCAGALGLSLRLKWSDLSHRLCLSIFDLSVIISNEEKENEKRSEIDCNSFLFDHGIMTMTCDRHRDTPISRSI